ncbi:hypothetical protein CC79DRAFT_689927 [Sarocladium strictum]
MQSPLHRCASGLWNRRHILPGAPMVPWWIEPEFGGYRSQRSHGSDLERHSGSHPIRPLTSPCSNRTHERVAWLFRLRLSRNLAAHLSETHPWSARGAVISPRHQTTPLRRVAPVSSIPTNFSRNRSAALKSKHKWRRPSAPTIETCAMLIATSLPHAWKAPCVIEG